MVRMVEGSGILGARALRMAYARDLVVRTAKVGWLGHLARGVGLEGALDDLCDREAEVELAIFRAHHAATVKAASPLALELLDHLDHDPGALAGRLRPGGDWRRWVCGERPRHASRSYGRFGPPSEVEAAGRHERHAFLHGCFVLREWSDPAGALGVRLSPAGLEIGARFGPVHLRTLGGRATLTTGLEVPETIRCACVGRPVEAVFDHAILRGRGYVIEEQIDRVPTIDDPRRAWRIGFGAAPVPWAVPWR